MPRIRKGGGASVRPAAAGGASTVPGRSGGNLNEQLLLDKNNALVSDIHSSVEVLRDISLQIGEVARKQNQMLDGMDDDMSAAGRQLKGAVRRIYSLVSSGGGRHMCYLILFSFAVFCFIYFLI